MQQVNGTAKALADKKAAARTAAGIAVQVAVGIGGLDALKAFDAAVDSLRKSGMVTVGAAQLDEVGAHVSKLTYALAQAYVLIEEHETDRGDDCVSASEQGQLVLQLIEQALGGKPQKVEAAPDAAPDATQH